MKLLISSILITCLFLIYFTNCNSKKKTDVDVNTNTDTEATIYTYTVKDIDGKEFDMASLKGKKVLIVNVASKCGLTPQYEKLEALFQKYKDQNFTIIAFPSNNFKDQESGTDAEIKEFCTLNYGVTFPIMSKVDVIGDNQVPIYQWLTQQSEKKDLGSTVTWNFQKYLINEDGSLYGVSAPKNSPDEDYIVKWIEGKQIESVK